MIAYAETDQWYRTYIEQMSSQAQIVAWKDDKMITMDVYVLLMDDLDCRIDFLMIDIMESLVNELGSHQEALKYADLKHGTICEGQIAKKYWYRIRQELSLEIIKINQ